MLDALSLHNFLLVTRSTISFQSGFCVLTGETGAGKSILINALSLALGARGSSSWIRNGCTQTTIIAQFSSLTPALQAHLDTLAIDYETDSLSLRRVLFADGKKHIPIIRMKVLLHAL